VSGLVDKARLCAWLRGEAQRDERSPSGIARVIERGDFDPEGELRKLRENFAKYLLPAYRADPCVIAKLCDEEIDQTGNLLGIVRGLAAARPEPKP
jgi:hypothetical protein